ncbi:hypothetical protein [Flavobacterium sp. UBA6031]|uniref:hypothetical protein n=1 Tax=Flavobacterium sp. UBA6031 TaxID=1946551 RepID=UPI0025C6EA87|nr:hypothetical protein [Flavobacterium sp. UBA6031]
MASTYKTGCIQNVANFETLISYITAFGTDYNPSKNSLTIPELQKKLSESKVSLSTVNVAFSAHSNASAARESAFEPLSKLVTRANNALKATDTTTQVDDSAKTLVRKIQGTRASTKFTEEEKKALEAEGKSATQISTSQMGFNDRLENFDKFITLLSSIPNYAPNEEDLKITSLSALRDDLRTKNTEVLPTEVQLSNASIARNDIQDRPLTGLVDIAFDAKVYIKSVFGATSPQYKQVSKLAFVKQKK